jgi:hypothetical protein
MKTMRTGLNQIFLVTFLAVILITGSVHAEGKEACVVSGLENISEPVLELEKWMLNETYWYNAQDSFLGEYHAVEQNLGLEAWMVDESKWQVPRIESVPEVEDQKLMVENWMTDMMYWN